MLFLDFQGKARPQNALQVTKVRPGLGPMPSQPLPEFRLHGFHPPTSPVLHSLGTTLGGTLGFGVKESSGQQEVWQCPHRTQRGAPSPDLSTPRPRQPPSAGPDGVKSAEALSSAWNTTLVYGRSQSGQQSQVTSHRLGCHECPWIWGGCQLLGQSSPILVQR
jgi:hypothetical protein